MIPTKVSYFIEDPLLEERLLRNNQEEPEKLNWEIVSMNGGYCQNALVFDPFRVKDHNRCSEDIDFCPLGQMKNFTDPITLNSRQHFILPKSRIVNGVAEGSFMFHVVKLISCYFSASNLYVRLHLPDNRTTCSKLELYSPVDFHWIVESSANFSLMSLQEDLASRLNIEISRVGIDYTREFSGKRCSIFNIHLILSQKEKSDFLDSFDFQNRKFKTDSSIDCSSTEDSFSSSPSLCFSFLIFFVFQFF